MSALEGKGAGRGGAECLTSSNICLFLKLQISIVDSLFLNISFHASFRTTCPSGCSENYVRFSSNRCDSAFVAVFHTNLCIFITASEFDDFSSLLYLWNFDAPDFRVPEKRCFHLE